MPPTRRWLWQPTLTTLTSLTRQGYKPFTCYHTRMGTVGHLYWLMDSVPQRYFARSHRKTSKLFAISRSGHILAVTRASLSCQKEAFPCLQRMKTLVKNEVECIRYGGITTIVRPCQQRIIRKLQISTLRQGSGSKSCVDRTLSIGYNCCRAEC